MIHLNPVLHNLIGRCCTRQLCPKSPWGLYSLLRTYVLRAPKYQFFFTSLPVTEQYSSPRPARRIACRPASASSSGSTSATVQRISAKLWMQRSATDPSAIARCTGQPRAPPHVSSSGGSSRARFSSASGPIIFEDSTSPRSKFAGGSPVRSSQSTTPKANVSVL